MRTTERETHILMSHAERRVKRSESGTGRAEWPSSLTETEGCSEKRE